MSRTLLIDADIMAFKAASGTEGIFHFDGGDAAPATSENLDAALEAAQRDIEAVAKKLKATKVIVCLTDDVDQATGTITNFRRGVYPAYKQHRLTAHRPATLGRVKEFYAELYECYQRPGLEADDCMGILATSETLVPGEKIIVSADKDMKTIPGLLFNPQKHKRPVTIKPHDADLFFLHQTLVGDVTDGYPGAPGIGEKSPFVDLLAKAPTLAAGWQLVLAAYAYRGLKPADALVQARCARILRATDWDFKERKVRLWTPPVESRG